MTTALDPQRAVQYLALLSPDLEAAAVLDTAGELLAGSTIDDLPGHHVSATEGDLTLAASIRRTAPLRLFQHDVATALKAMV
jgi:hypothetical protein